MKIAACAICKNEEENISKWLEYTKDFDYRIVVDTGSADRSVELLSKSDVILAQKKFEPFRFDDARNFVMTLIPDDVDWCIWPDFDEYYSDNTIDEIKKAVEENPKVTRLTYKTFLIKNGIKIKGLESGTVMESKIHVNKLYKWKEPIHENLDFIGMKNETIKQVDNIQRFHKQNISKERVKQYFEIAKTALENNSKDSYSAWFVLKDCYYSLNDIDNSIKYAKHYLDITKPYTNFRSLALLILANCEAKKYGITPSTTLTLLRSASENPKNIEAWRGLINASFELEDWHMVLLATSILKDSNPHFEEPYKIALNKIQTEKKTVDRSGLEEE
tara:strand:+ start:37251 stop:38246 length:996 start_codon:yes stop_codon:yes gene_type:complete